MNTTIVARFDGKCSKCNNLMPAGSRIQWDRTNRKASHLTCPVVADVELELDGEALQARLERLDEQIGQARAVLNDQVLERHGERPGVCPKCLGSGYVTARVNCSDTLDFSDFQTFNYPCGADFKLEWTRRSDWFSDPHARLDGEETQRFTVDPRTGDRVPRDWSGYGALYLTTSASRPGLNMDCLAGRQAREAWDRAQEDLEALAAGKVTDLERAVKLAARVWGCSARQLIEG